MKTFPVCANLDGRSCYIQLGDICQETKIMLHFWPTLSVRPFKRQRTRRLIKTRKLEGGKAVHFHSYLKFRTFQSLLSCVNQCKATRKIKIEHKIAKSQPKEFEQSKSNLASHSISFLRQRLKATEQNRYILTACCLSCRRKEMERQVLGTR